MCPAHAFDSIPILDLSLVGDVEGKKRLLDGLRHALTEVGFLYVTNHGVPDDVVADIVDSLPQLFPLPQDAKNEIALSNSPHFLGYSGDGSETTAGKADRREQVEFATELEETWTEETPLRERLRGPNQWPRTFPGLRKTVESYIHELTLLGDRFLRLVAEALLLPPGTFIPFLSDQHRLKLVHYPAVPSSEAQGVGAHKDSSGWWTFLLQASPEVNGLQALNKDGKWIDVPPIPGSFVVNIGQAFEVVTHGICRATTHRVLAGPEERFSIPFFQGVRRDLTKDEALQTLQDHFDQWRQDDTGAESTEGKEIDSAFLKGKYNTWGESQLRTKIRSHRDVGKRFYGDVFDKYINDDK